MNAGSSIPPRPKRNHPKPLCRFPAAAGGASTVKDAALIAAAQRIEHYEMAGYGAVRTYADILEYDEISDMLQETLDEEGEADETLTDLAEGDLFTAGINEEAAA